MTVLAWLAGSRLGRGVAVVLLALVAFSAAIARAFLQGRQAAEIDQKKQALDNLRNRISTDEELDRLPPDARRDRLRQWARD